MKLSHSLRLALFSGVYFAQGISMAFFLTFNILYLGESGYGPQDVGLMQSLLLLPFILKIFIGIFSDAVSLFGLGHRKPYMLIGLLGQASIFLLIPFVSVADGLGTYAIAALLASLSMALYDTSTDGLALDTTPEDERGLVQGIMNGSRALGILVMLLLGGQVVEFFGWSWYFWTSLILILVPS
jgi:PAT family beta-lactamase induction signal transducer AmpG